MYLYSNKENHFFTLKIKKLNKINYFAYSLLFVLAIFVSLFKIFNNQYQFLGEI